MVAPIPAKRGRKPAVATAPATGQVQSLTRGLKLLEWIAESNGSVALTELAQQAGLPNSTTHRLLTTMQQQGFVRQVGELGHWAIGAHAFMVGSSFLQSRNLLAIVHPILRNLMEESGEILVNPSMVTPLKLSMWKNCSYSPSKVRFRRNKKGSGTNPEP